MTAPPGVPFWARNLPRALAPPVALYALLHVLARQNVLTRSALWVRVLACLLVAPMYFYCKSIWTLMKHRRRAWKRGAKLFPVRHGSLPLDIDLLHQALQALPHEYATDFIGSAFAPNSRTFLLNVLGETRGIHTSAISRFSSLSSPLHRSFHDRTPLYQTYLGRKLPKRTTSREDKSPHRLK
jgi:hypothetical protein